MDSVKKALRQPRWDSVTLPDGTTHADWLRAHAAEYTAIEIGNILGRTEAAVEQKLLRFGLHAKPALTESYGDHVQGIPIKAFLKAIERRPQSLQELSQRFDRSEETIRKAISTLRAMCYEITEVEAERVVSGIKAPMPVEVPATLWDEPYGEITFGCVSDTHFGSRWAQITNLHRCVKEMAALGIRHILVSGDIFAGDTADYKDFRRDVVTSDAEDQLALGIDYWPREDGVEFYLISGNHDWSFVRAAGFNIVRALCRERDDMTYVGPSMADVPLTPQVDARLWHPRGGATYAHSYRLQKLAEQVAFEELAKALSSKGSSRLRFILSGHMHRILVFWQSSIYSAIVGCFEGKTRYVKERGWMSQLGALAVRAEITKGGALRSVEDKYFNFDEIERDYENYPIVEKEAHVETLFQWEGEQSREVNT